MIEQATQAAMLMEKLLSAAIAAVALAIYLRLVWDRYGREITMWWRGVRQHWLDQRDESERLRLMWEGPNG